MNSQSSIYCGKESWANLEEERGEPCEYPGQNIPGDDKR